MKSISVFLVTIFIISYGCNQKTSSDTVNKKYAPVIINEDNIIPTVDIKNYTLITDNADDRRADAKEIMKVKRKWPLAMQTRDTSLFESILAKNFTFNGGDKFYNRADYISDRTKINDWKITLVKYQNIVLQFFGDIAVLTYRNIVENTDTAGEVEIENITWADIYVKEKGKWMIGAAHSIDYEMSKPDKKAK